MVASILGLGVQDGWAGSGRWCFDRGLVYIYVEYVGQSIRLGKANANVNAHAMSCDDNGY